jgi:UDPglucose--hexose-1-phosphate uridylyltransferase
VPQRCLFCRGHEADTPAAVATYDWRGQPADDSLWQVRVVQNKYPALELDERPLTINSALYEVGPGSGVHEVIVEAPEHVLSFGDLDECQAELAFLAYRDRLLNLRANPRIAYGQLFKNSGSAAGASLEHTHSQLIGTPIIPTQIQAELARSRSYFERHGQCVFCAMIEEELSAGARVVFESEAFLAFCPYASQFPYEIWILPKRHACSFEMAEDGEIRDLARIAQAMIRRVECGLNNPAFNFLIHTSPFRLSPVSYFHWHLEFFPRLTKTAGFEWGAGDYINTVSPEDAARILRVACRVP